MKHHYPIRFFIYTLLLILPQIVLAKPTLTIMAWEGYADPPFVDKYKQLIKKKYGKEIAVKVVYPSDPQEFFDGARSNSVDIISPAHNILKSYRWKLIDNNLALPLNLDNVPNYKKVIKPLQFADYITKDGKVYGAPLVYGPYGLMYNTSIIKEAPDSWNIFWDPKYKGKYAISEDYHEANIYITGLAMGYNKDEIFTIKKANNKNFKSRLAALSKNAKKRWIGVDTAKDLKGLSFATAWGFSIPELKKQGEVWKMASPKEGTTGWVDNWVLCRALKDRPEMKKFAEEWINYSLGEEMQISYLRNINQSPVNHTVKDKLTEEEIKNFHIGDDNYYKENVILWKILPKRDQNGFKVLWKKAKDE